MSPYIKHINIGERMLCKKPLFLVLLLLFCAVSSKAQTTDFKQQRRQLVLYNIGLNGLIGGIGSLINHHGEQADFQTFLRGFYKGAAGGYVSHLGLKMTNKIFEKENIGYAWPARLMNSLGSSMVQNAAEDRKLFERLHFNLYLTRLEYNTDLRKFKARLFTSSLYGLAVVGRGAKLDLSKSLKSGVFFFQSDGRFSSSLGSGRATGQVSSIGLRADLTGSEFYDVVAEEVAHILQYDRKVGGNAMFYKTDQRLKGQWKFYQNLSRYVYFDLNGPTFFLFYLFEDATQCNFYEQEAVNYANKRIDFCDRN